MNLLYIELLIIFIEDDTSEVSKTIIFLYFVEKLKQNSGEEKKSLCLKCKTCLSNHANQFHI